MRVRIVGAKGNGGSGLDTSRAQAQWLSTLTVTAFLSHLVERSSVASPFAHHRYTSMYLCCRSVETLNHIFIEIYIFMKKFFKTHGKVTQCHGSLATAVHEAT